MLAVVSIRVLSSVGMGRGPLLDDGNGGMKGAV